MVLGAPRIRGGGILIRFPLRFASVGLRQVRQAIDEPPGARPPSDDGLYGLSMARHLGREKVVQVFANCYRCPGLAAQGDHRGARARPPASAPQAGHPRGYRSRSQSTLNSHQ